MHVQLYGIMNDTSVLVSKQLLLASAHAKQGAPLDSCLPCACTLRDGCTCFYYAITTAVAGGLLPQSRLPCLNPGCLLSHLNSCNTRSEQPQTPVSRPQAVGGRCCLIVHVHVLAYMQLCHVLHPCRLPVSYKCNVRVFVLPVPAAPSGTAHVLR